MFHKSFAIAGVVLASLTSGAGAFTVPGYPQVNIVSPNAHIDLLPGAFLTLGPSNQAPAETSSAPSASTGSEPQTAPAVQSAPIVRSAPTTSAQSAGSDDSSPVAKLAQLPSSILDQISNSASSPSQTDIGGGIGPGGAGTGGSQRGISPVPLPPGLPLFGVALIATAILGQGRKLRNAVK